MPKKSRNSKNFDEISGEVSEIPQKHTYHQESIKKLLMVLDCFNLIYEMEHQKIKNLSDDVSKNRPKSQARKWVSINDKSRKNYNSNNEIKFNLLILRSNLCDFDHSYIVVKETIRVKAAVERDRANRQLIFKYCAPFTSCISEVNNT